MGLISQLKMNGCGIERHYGHICTILVLSCGNGVGLWLEDGGSDLVRLSVVMMKAELGSAPPTNGNPE